MGGKLEGAEAQIQYLADYILREHSDAIVNAGAGVVAVNELTRLKAEVERLERGVKWIADQLGAYGNPADGQMWLDGLLSGDSAPMKKEGE